MKRCVLAALLVASACSSGPPKAPPDLGPVNKELEDVTLTLFFAQQDRLTEELPVNLGIAVVAKRPVTLEFSTSQRYEFIVSTSSNKKVWGSSDEEAFLMVLGQETISEGDSRDYGESWTPTQPGKYRILGRITTSNRDDLRLTRDVEVE